MSLSGRLCLDSTVVKPSTLCRGQVLFRLTRFLLLHNSIRPATVGLPLRILTGSYVISLSFGLEKSRSSNLLYLVKQGTCRRCRSALGFLPFVVAERTAQQQHHDEHIRVVPKSC